MNSSASRPQPPVWLFILTDLAFIAAAAFIAWGSPAPLSTTAVLAIVACIGLGAITGLVPLILRAERLKNEALDERQSALEALARTVSSSAEQISIAAGGLHEIAELAQKNLRHAEQLPHKLQDKIAEFQAQLAVADDAEKEELERELLSLRTSESERLESVSQRIAKAAADGAKLEAAMRQHLAAANESLAALATGTTAAVANSRAAAEEALAQARAETARALAEASGQSLRDLATARSAALAELSAGAVAAIELASQSLTNSVVEAVRTLDARIAELNAAALRVHAPAAPAAAPVVMPAPAEAVAAAEATAPVATPEAADAPEATPALPKRARKPRREEPPSPPTEAAAPESPAPTASEPPPAPAAEPPPIPAEAIPEVVPVAPDSAEPFAAHPVSQPPASDAPPPATEAAPKPVRKRAASKQPESENDFDLGLELDDSIPNSSAGPTERVLTSDGATRLLVTAYIGIGNRLFIRGDGPGLSWEKGIPLQFVSIGKWRWESYDASAPITFKIYKNDEIECAGLGRQTLDPAHQYEMTATF